MATGISSSIVTLGAHGCSGQEGCSVVEEALGVNGFRLALRAVHSPQQVGQMGGVGSRSPIPDWGTGSPGCLHLGVERTVLDDGSDVEPPDVDALLSHLGVEGLEV